MLLPAKFQTSTPAALGAKVVAIAPAPKPGRSAYLPFHEEMGEVDDWRGGSCNGAVRGDRRGCAT